MDTLNNLINQTMTSYQQYEEEKKRKAEEEKKRRERGAERTLSTLLEEVLSPEFRASVEMSYKHNYSSYNGAHSVQAVFSYLDQNWVLAHDRGKWDITTRSHRSDYPQTRAGSISSEYLQSMLLVEMGKYKQEYEEEQAHQKARKRYEEEQRQYREKLEKEEAANESARQSKRIQEHQRLTSLFDEIKAKAQREMWHWPEGKTIEIYYLEYCKGSYCDEDGDRYFDYDGGWTSASELDERGRIRIEPTKLYTWDDETDPRIIQLMPDVHKPVWKVFTVSSVEDLPGHLCQEVKASLPNAEMQRDHYGDDLRLAEVEGLAADRWHVAVIGREPLQWIKDLVESR